MHTPDVPTVIGTDAAAMDAVATAVDAAALLDPDLREALASGTAPPFTRLTQNAVELPILTSAGAAALEAELAAAPMQPRLELTRFDGGASEWPLAASLGALLAREVMPRFARLVSEDAQDNLKLCDETLTYVLRYGGASAGIVDKGRVFRCHQDDADLTLAVCIGAASGWRGSDLLYVTSVADDERPGTPDLDDPSTATISHEHSLGVGVLHDGSAYHMVSPLREGERLTLVVMAMRDDAAWKRTFFRQDRQENAPHEG